MAQRLRCPNTFSIGRQKNAISDFFKGIHCSDQRPFAYGYTADRSDQGSREVKISFSIGRQKNQIVPHGSADDLFPLHPNLFLIKCAEAVTFSKEGPQISLRFDLAFFHVVDMIKEAQ